MSEAPKAWLTRSGRYGERDDWALEQGWKPASLGSRVLRAETASVATLSLLALE